MSVSRKGPLSQFYAGALKARLAVAEQEIAQLRKEREAKSVQIQALRRALIASVGKERRLRERLAAQARSSHARQEGKSMGSTPGERNRAYESVLSPTPDADGRYWGFWRDHRIEVAVAGGAGALAFLAYVDGKEIAGVYDSRNIAETAARIEIDHLEVCEVEG
jgi:hypothetical protein